MNPLLTTVAVLLAVTASSIGADSKAIKPHDEEAIQRAVAGDAKMAERARLDTNRPAYHLVAPGGWINDPNGPIFHNGYWHMFYQHNPYGDGWGNMHWGHIRSHDLAHWERLPIALWPSKEVGEDHVFSGCSLIRADGKPAILYTSIGRGKSATDYAEQWLALGDDDLLKWEKIGPALLPSIHGDMKVWDWRDPFLFKYKGADYLVLGGNLNHGKGGEAIVNLYKAKDASLMNWEYLGVLFKHPDPKVVNIECPNFFELDGKWILIVSPHRRVEYFIGNFDGKTFTSEKQGLLDASDNFYAPNCATDPAGRRILWGWIRGFKDGQGWNGAHTVPRVLNITAAGELKQEPAKEIETLRKKHLISLVQKPLAKESPIQASPDSAQFEINAAFHDGNNCGIRLFKSETNPGLEILYGEGQLHVGDKTASLALSGKDPLNLRVFVDHSVIEVYANQRLCLTRVFHPAAKPSVEFFARAEDQTLNAEIFELESAW
ncbi:MAG TPA: glycoside hydrolase family 32 protein [Verrucomicrobiae bacterium]|jgi:beta-fructofuranosidase|nr:glycoside hydrolase family 32 protein [Verrucomicrobiae bacterium]